MTSLSVDGLTRKHRVVASVNALLATLTFMLAICLPLAFIAGIEYIRIYQP